MIAWYALAKVRFRLSSTSIESPSDVGGCVLTKILFLALPGVHFTAFGPQFLMPLLWCFLF